MCQDCWEADQEESRDVFGLNSTEEGSRKGKGDDVDVGNEGAVARGETRVPGVL